MIRGILLVAALCGAAVPSAEAWVAQAAVGAGTTLNPSDIGLHQTLSNGNLTDLHDTTASWDGVRSTTNKTTGKLCIGVTINLPDNFGSASGNISIGLADLTLNLLGYQGADTHAGAYYPNTGNWAYNNSFTADFPTAANGDQLNFCFDIGGGVVQINVNGGSYVSHAESFPASPYVSFFGLGDGGGNGSQGTFNFHPAGTLPVGYSAWQ